MTAHLSSVHPLRNLCTRLLIAQPVTATLRLPLPLPIRANSIPAMQMDIINETERLPTTATRGDPAPRRMIQTSFMDTIISRSVENTHKSSLWFSKRFSSTSWKLYPVFPPYQHLHSQNASFFKKKNQTLVIYFFKKKPFHRYANYCCYLRCTQFHPTVKPLHAAVRKRCLVLEAKPIWRERIQGRCDKIQLIMDRLGRLRWDPLSSMWCLKIGRGTFLLIFKIYWLVRIHFSKL